MIRSTPKYSDTSIRVLQTLKILVEKDSSIQDIINYFEVMDSHNKTYTNEAILKYINTLKVFGFKFVKNKDKYVLLNVPNQIDFDENELRIIKLIEDYSKVLPEKRVSDEINQFLQTLEKRFSKETIKLANRMTLPNSVLGISYEKYEKKVREYEKYCADRLKLKIIYWHTQDAKASVVVEPKSIEYKENTVYLRAYNPISAQIQDFNINEIIRIEQLPVKATPSNILSSVTFRLSGRLANGYKLHDDERLVNIESDGKILIMNQTEDKTLLLRRLMRYGTYCEVVSPKKFREDMGDLIKKTLGKYK